AWPARTTHANTSASSRRAGRAVPRVPPHGRNRTTPRVTAAARRQQPAAAARKHRPRQLDAARKRRYTRQDAARAPQTQDCAGTVPCPASRTGNGVLTSVLPPGSFPTQSFFNVPPPARREGDFPFSRHAGPTGGNTATRGWLHEQRQPTEKPLPESVGRPRAAGA